MRKYIHTNTGNEIKIVGRLAGSLAGFFQGEFCLCDPASLYVAYGPDQEAVKPKEKAEQHEVSELGAGYEKFSPVSEQIKLGV